MPSCAGCLPMRHQKTSAARIPSCLEPVVFPGSVTGASAKVWRPSYQCLACSRLWIYDEARGYLAQSPMPLQRAA